MFDSVERKAYFNALVTELGEGWSAHARGIIYDTVTMRAPDKSHVWLQCWSLSCNRRIRGCMVDGAWVDGFATRMDFRTGGAEADAERIRKWYMETWLPFATRWREKQAKRQAERDAREHVKQRLLAAIDGRRERHIGVECKQSGIEGKPMKLLLTVPDANVVELEQWFARLADE